MPEKLLCQKCGAALGEPEYHSSQYGTTFTGVTVCDYDGMHLHYYCVCGTSMTIPVPDDVQGTLSHGVTGM
jgi:hypothetical protein